MTRGRQTPLRRGGRPVHLLLALAAIAVVAVGCHRNADCFGEDLFGQGYDCGGPRFLSRGDACWTVDGASGYREREHRIATIGGLTCQPGDYCDTSRGCRALIASGESCDGLPPELLWGMCADPTEACYPADLDGSGGSAGRVCRKLPTTEGAFCDASVKPDCDDYLLPDGTAPTYFGAAYAWQFTQGYDHPEWNGSGFTGEHLVEAAIASNHYPALRLPRLICANSRCSPPPAPGEPCADLGGAATYPALGPNRFVCAQPEDFVVQPSTLGAGFAASYDFGKAVYCIEGRCTPASALAPDTCFAPDGTAAPLDPSWCSSAAESCLGGSLTCLSPCRSDGSCGMCRVCEREDETRVAVEGSGDCVEQGGAWEQISERLVTATSQGLQCGYRYAFDFDALEPVTGELWLELAANGAFTAPDAAFDIFVDDTLVDRWFPASDCYPIGGPFQLPARRSLRLNTAAASDGRLRVELRGTESVCTSCQDAGGPCASGTNCPGNNLTITLQNRTRTYLGLIRDDLVCQPQ